VDTPKSLIYTKVRRCIHSQKQKRRAYDKTFKEEAVKLVVEESRKAADILDAAHQFGCGTIVMGRRGSTNVKDYTLGSVSRKVLQDCSDAALWIVP